MAVLLTSRTRSNLLGFFFTHADEGYYVRELASLIHEDAGNLSRELRRLEHEGLLCARMKGRIKFYTLNKDYPLYADIKKIVFKTEGVEGVLRKLVLLHKGIALSFIYGSFAKGVEKKVSDVDLVVVGKFNRDRFTGELRSLESRLSREINFVSYTKEEFERERKKTGSFLNVVLKGKVIVLRGSFDGR